MKKMILLGAVLVIGVISGVLFQQWRAQQSTPATTGTTADATVRPAFALKDLDDKIQDIRQWDGQVLMINFWATWCPPCRKELPDFIRLQEQYASQGFTIIGIALDTKQAVIDFTDPMGINYPLLMAEQEGIPLSKAYGNHLGVLPFTVFVDRKGNIVRRHRSDLSFELAESVIKPLL